jgi:hypothetical protein
MQGTEIFGPFFGMLMLTFVVWAVMYSRRISWIVKNKIDTQELNTPEKGAAVAPESVSFPSHKLRNMFVMPVMFYALCLYLFVTGNVDSTYMISAWVFLVFRSIHSAIHCTVNIVRLRFLTYMIATFTLWFMMFRAVLDFYSTLPA